MHTRHTAARAPHREVRGPRTTITLVAVLASFAASAGQAAPALTQAVAPITLPKLAAGTPQMVATPGSAAAAGHTAIAPIDASVVQLRGATGIQQATNLPQGVRDFLLLHARTLAPGEVTNYVVNLELAAAWFRDHPEPDSVHQAATASHDSHTGCNALSTQCAGEVLKHAEDEARRQAQAEWDHVTGDVTKAWNMAQECFSEATLKAEVPLRFSVTPGFPLTAGTDGALKTPTGVHGQIDLGLPLDVNVSTELDVSYIPCLPFAVRPVRIAANGALEVGERIQATLTTSGQFKQIFAIPPGGGADFPVEMIPITIGNTPIARLDISVYLDGQMTLDGGATLNGTLSAEIKQRTDLGFACTGSGCDLSVGGQIKPLTTTESVRLDGRVRLTPAVLAALQISFDGDLLSARAGVQPFMQVTIDGCSSAAATQNTAGAAAAEQSDALLADFDTGIEVLAEARVGSVKVGSRSWKQDVRHLALQDLAHSSALRPVLSGASDALANQPVAYRVKMPGCYPYTDTIDYRIDSGGTAGATVPSATAMSARDAAGALSGPAGAGGTKLGSGAPAGCSLTSGSAHCSGDPRRELVVDANWPAAGDYTLRAALLRDAHGREFGTVAPTLQTVHVGAAQKQSAASSATAIPTTPTDTPAAMGHPLNAWSLQPNLKLKGQMGSLVVAMPAGTGNTLVRVRPAGQTVTAFSGLGKQTHSLPPGTYDVSIGGATVPGVEVRSGSNTEIFVGGLKVTTDQTTTYEVLDGMNQRVAKSYGTSITALPAGTYVLKIGGRSQAVTIEADKIVEY
jgi:hypothetical protein